MLRLRRELRSGEREIVPGIYGHYTDMWLVNAETGVLVQSEEVIEAFERLDVTGVHVRMKQDAFGMTKYPMFGRILDINNDFVVLDSVSDAKPVEFKVPVNEFKQVYELD